MTISQELKKKAIKLGLCQEWTNEWVNPNLDELVQMYINGIDFCIVNNFPTNKYIKKNFGKVAMDQGVYTDTEINLVNPNITILNGQTKGCITLNGFTSRDIYVRHKSNVTIVISDFAKAFIRLFDDSKVRIINNTNNRIFVYRYSKSSQVRGNAEIREKTLKEL